MGYPMSWWRVRHRNNYNGLAQGYHHSNLSGDLLRFENDVRNPDQCAVYAREAGVEPDVVRRVLDAVLKWDGLQPPLPGGASTAPDARCGWPQKAAS